MNNNTEYDLKETSMSSNEKKFRELQALFDQINIAKLSQTERDLQAAQSKLDELTMSEQDSKVHSSATTVHDAPSLKTNTTALVLYDKNADSTNSELTAAVNALVCSDSVDEPKTLQAKLSALGDLLDCHCRITDVLYLLYEYKQYPEEFLDQLHIINLYLMTEDEHSEPILRSINKYSARQFRVFKNGLSQTYDIKKCFGHSVLGWQDRHGNWFALDFLFMPIYDVGHGMPLVNHLTLVVHNDPCPVIVVPVVSHPSRY